MAIGRKVTSRVACKGHKRFCVGFGVGFGMGFGVEFIYNLSFAFLFAFLFLVVASPLPRFIFALPRDSGGEVRSGPRFRGLAFLVHRFRSLLA